MVVRREAAEAARLHPPKVIKLPLAFPFVISPARTSIDGRNLRQRQPALMEAVPCAVDARHLSVEFQRLRSDPDLVRFLGRFGWWDGRRKVPLEEVWEFQEWLRLVLRGSYEFRAKQLSPRGLFGRLPGVLARSFSLTFAAKKGVATFTVQTNCCLDAITATVLIDTVQNTSYKECKSDDCAVLFPWKPGKDFCSERCQHREVVRRSRPPYRPR
jgi:hypothetical protein